MKSLLEGLAAPSRADRGGGPDTTQKRCKKGRFMEKATEAADLLDGLCLTDAVEKGSSGR